MAEEVLKQFEYYYGLEAESFYFIQVPRFLFNNPKFQVIRPESKILYSLMLDRMSLSRKNGWLDENNRVYIYYTVEEMMKDISCKHSKCAEIVKELITFGLIEKKKQGMGRPDIIYVKNFLHELEDPSNPCNHTEIRNTDVKTSAESDIHNMDLKTSEIRISRDTENGSLDIRNTDTNYTILNSQNKNNQTDLSYTDTPPLLHKPEVNTEAVDEEEDEKEKIKKQIDYPRLKRLHPNNIALLDFIVSEMNNLMCSPDGRIELATNSYADTDLVKKNVSQITYDDIESNLLPVLDDKYDRTVKNPRAYMRTCLFNLVSRRGAICYTKDMKSKGGKNNQYYEYRHGNYDFDALEAELGLR